MGAGGLLLILPRGRAGDLLVQRQVAGGKVEAQRGKAGGEMLGQFGPHVDPATIGMIDPDAPGVKVHLAADRAAQKGVLAAIFAVADDGMADGRHMDRSEEHTSELQSLMRNSYAVFCLKKKRRTKQ